MPLSTPADGKPATLTGLVRVIGTVHRHWLRRKARKLKKVSARLACFAYLLAEGSEKWEQRARHQIGCERRHRQSSEESLRCLTAPLRFLSAAESGRRLSGFVRPSGYPAAWGPDMSSATRLRWLIEQRTAKLRGIAAADEGQPATSMRGPLKRSIINAPCMRRARAPPNSPSEARRARCGRLGTPAYPQGSFGAVELPPWTS